METDNGSIAVIYHFLFLAVLLWFHRPVCQKVVVSVTEPNVVQNIHATADVNSLTITWDAPKEGLVEKYTTTVGSETVTTDISNRTATFKKLIAGQQYTVVVVALSGNQKSADTMGRFYTSKSQISNSFLNKC